MLGFGVGSAADCVDRRVVTDPHEHALIIPWAFGAGGGVWPLVALAPPV